MKNILVTGVAGFIGSHVICYLVERYKDYQFIGIDKISYCSELKNIEEISEAKNFIFIKADFTNLDFMDYIFCFYKIDTVLHLGAYTHVDMSFGQSIIYTQNNVVGTHVLLETANKYGIEKFIYVSTDEVYGCKADESDENTLLEPTNPYAATKAAAEQLVRSYYHSYKLPIIITRSNNIYGPKQYPEKVCPCFILNAINSRTLQIQGSGLQKRSFLYVDDLCLAFDCVLTRGEVGTTYNIGSNDEYTVLDLAEKIKQYFPQISLEFIADRPFNDQRYSISTDKINKLGWHQQTSFDHGLRQTVDWYIQHPTYFKY